MILCISNGPSSSSLHLPPHPHLPSLPPSFSFRLTTFYLAREILSSFPPNLRTKRPKLTGGSRTATRSHDTPTPVSRSGFPRSVTLITTSTRGGTLKTWWSLTNWTVCHSLGTSKGQKTLTQKHRSQRHCQQSFYVPLLPPLGSLNFFGPTLSHHNQGRRGQRGVTTRQAARLYTTRTPHALGPSIPEDEAGILVHSELPNNRYPLRSCCVVLRETSTDHWCI